MSHDEVETVLICSRCGRGFLEASGLHPGSFDTSRTWAWLGAAVGGDQCGGRVFDVPKHYQVRKLNEELTHDEGETSDD